MSRNLESRLIINNIDYNKDMKNITKFCAKSDIKPLFTKVYVYEEDGDKFAVATDSFRLIEWKIEDDFAKEYITPGYYNVKNWVEMCKSFNKKNRDVVSFVNAIKSNSVINENFKEDFPDYKKLIPGETINFDGTIQVNKDYFFDFVDMMPSNKFTALDFSEIKQNNKMLYYSNEDTKILLMGLNK